MGHLAHIGQDANSLRIEMECPVVRSLFAGLLLSVTCSLHAATEAHAQAADPAELLSRHARAGTLAAGETELAALPQDAQAVAARGMIKFARAVEMFGQGLYRYGQRPAGVFDRFPPWHLQVPANPNPERLTYGRLRALYARFLADLVDTEASLAHLPAGAVRLPLDLNAVKLDLDGSGAQNSAHSLGQMIARWMPGRDLAASMQRPDDQWLVRFDRADVVWLRGYCHFVAAQLETALAFDWHQIYDQYADAVFAGAARERPEEDPGPADLESRIQRGEALGYFELGVAIHLVRWPVAAPERLLSVRDRLKIVVALSRQSWAEAMAETDDDHEWLPNPRQSNRAGPGFPPTPEQLAVWQTALNDMEAALDGKLLVRHPRYRRGFDLGRALEQMRSFDLMMWIAGHGIVPYLKDGPVASQASIDWWLRRLGTGARLNYARWFD